METPQGSTISKLSIAIIVISGIELILTVLLAIGLSVGTSTILQSDPMNKMANRISETLESASIEVGSIEVNVQSQDGATVTYSNIPNISTKKLKDAGVLDENGNFVGSRSDRIATGIISVAITAATVAAILAFFTLVAGLIAFSNSAKPRKFGKVFGWSLAAGILCVLVGRLVLGVLFVIIAVCAHKGKRAFQDFESANSANLSAVEQWAAQAEAPKKPNR